MVSGGSSGLGKALVEKLAQQGLNVVIIALNDKILEETHKELVSKYPKIEFRAIGVDLGTSDHTNGQDYMKEIIEKTDDLDIQIVFNNAGYLVMRGFIKSSIETHLKNFETNAISHMRVTHHFMKKMAEKKLKGCFVFTSSPTGFLPSPSNVIYGSSKAFLIHFAQCLATEAKFYGIDVLVANMGPMSSNFYNDESRVPKISFINMTNYIRSTPAMAADVLLGSVGKVTHRDHSLFTIFTRLFLKLIDPNFVIEIIARASPYTSDFKKNPDLI